jgi:hypothetical protein
MLRKLGYFVMVLGLALPALAVDGPGSISGYVRSSAGVPQMGAVVEVLSVAAHDLKVFTDLQPQSHSSFVSPRSARSHWFARGFSNGRQRHLEHAV